MKLTVNNYSSEYDLIKVGRWNIQTNFVRVTGFCFSK
jgi:hypothetical protein